MYYTVMIRSTVEEIGYPGPHLPLKPLIYMLYYVYEIMQKKQHTHMKQKIVRMHKLSFYVDIKSQEIKNETNIY